MLKRNTSLKADSLDHNTVALTLPKGQSRNSENTDNLLAPQVL